MQTTLVPIAKHWWNNYKRTLLVFPLFLIGYFVSYILYGLIIVITQIIIHIPLKNNILWVAMVLSVFIPLTIIWSLIEVKVPQIPRFLLKCLNGVIASYRWIRSWRFRITVDDSVEDKSNPKDFGQSLFVNSNDDNLSKAESLPLPSPIKIRPTKRSLFGNRI